MSWDPNRPRNEESKNETWNETNEFTWVMTDVPIFHITQPWMVYGLLDGDNNGDI